jgi:hypothetical protein
MPFRSAIAEIGEPAVVQRPAEITIAPDLYRRIGSARSWADLEAVLEDAQGEYAAGRLTAEDIEQLAGQATQRSRQIPETADESCLSYLFDEQSVRQVYSRVLGELAVFADDDAEVPTGFEGEVYRASELRQIVGRSPEQVRAIHATKKAFNGELSDKPRDGITVPAEDLLADSCKEDPADRIAE